MCMKMPKAPKPVNPPPIKPPEIQIGSDSPNEDPRLIKRRGRNQLRTDLGLALEKGLGSGLTLD